MEEINEDKYILKVLSVFCPDGVFILVQLNCECASKKKKKKINLRKLKCLWAKAISASIELNGTVAFGKFQRHRSSSAKLKLFFH